MNLDVKADNENCDYTHLIAESRNCYQVVACSAGEDCMYSAFIQRNRSVVDCFFVFDSELCYECIDCYRCYDLQHSQYCQSCIESAYLYNCRGLSNCFGCVSLVNKKHHIFNKPVSPEHYQSLLSRYLKNGEITAEARQEIDRLRKSCPQKAYAGLQNEDVSGDHISYSKNSFHCFDCTYLEDCKYCTWFHRSKDCMDCYGWGLEGELGYENHLVGNTFQRVLFCDSCWEGVSDLLYCRLCVNRCSNLFGCVGLRGKEYCILNKQFRKDDYQQLLPRIIEHLKAIGEWGEFFPPQISPFAYNETVACEYYPLSREQALEKKLVWQEQLPHSQGKETIPFGSPLPVTKEATEEITREVLACKNCKKNYRIVAQELRFYKKMGLTLPRLCFNCRHLARREQRNKRILHWRNCDKCGKKITSSFSPQQPEPVYCEECYQVAVQ